MPRASQAATSSSTRPQHRNRQEREESDESDHVPTQTQQRGVAATGDKDVQKRAAELVRYSLFSEYRRAPIRRDAVIKQILPNNGRAFPAVLAAAQAILRKTFGMELVELRTRKKIDSAGVEETQAAQTQAQTQTQRGGNKKGKGKGKGRSRRDEDDDEDDEDEEDEDEDEEADGEGGRKKGPKVTSSKTYILRSILPLDLIEAISRPRPLPALNGMDDETLAADSGALIQWEKGDGTGSGHVASLGIRTVIFCIILCSGRVIGDEALHSYLRRFNLMSDTILPRSSNDINEPPITLDKYLDLLARQNYLEKCKLPGTAEFGSIEWRWGSREAEFSEKAAAQFIERLMTKGDDEEEEEDEEEDAGARRRGHRDQPVETTEDRQERKRRRIREDIEKAAGGALTGSL